MGEDKQIHCLRSAYGRVTSVLSEIYEGAAKFYRDLFTAERCNDVCTGSLLENLVRLSESPKTDLDSPIALQ